MSNFTYASWQDFVAELIESHEKHYCSTREPVWMVQEKQVTYGMDPDYVDDYKWIEEGESTFCSPLELFNSQDAQTKHKINESSIKEHEELFTDLDESDQCDILEAVSKKLECNWYKTHYVENWVNIQVFLTRPDADRFIKRQGHNYRELRVYVESLWRSPQFSNLIQAILDGELKLVKGGDAQ
ncbi:hypothetical protein [Acinetobacter sp. Ac_5812]|uniref:hypothetical protein n=1 Tax=Acinetobacter sp. Ac_5812 TaxID=1848937 RepID=UPI00148F7ED1|nr:hypothetical protein [Acinetobacter sp. Ac_5812]NNP70433.1 hypothetical protein [Acinetobacter sp. Ac_5812]